MKSNHVKNNANTIMTSQKGQIDNSVDLFDKEYIQRREDEFMALEAILPQEQVSIRKAKHDGSQYTAPSVLFTIPVSLTKPKKVRILSHIISKRERSQNVTTSDLSTNFENLKVQSKFPKDGDSQDSFQKNWKEDIGETILENVSHLPTIRALVRLPNGYPDKEPPRIAYLASDFIGRISVQHDRIASTEWQKRTAFSFASTQAAMCRANIVKHLKSSLLNAWDEMPGEVLYSWYEMLRESLWSDDDSILAEETDKDGIVLHEYLVPGQDIPELRLASIIRTNDLLCKRKEFEGERYGCGICLDDVRGGKCWKLSCKHVFCQHCLFEYVSRSITDGYPRQATACPDPECVKLRVQAENAADSTSILHDDENVTKGLTHTHKVNEMGPGLITEDEIVSLVGANLLQRLRELQEKALVLRDPSFGFCPRPGCEQLVHGDPKDVGTPYESMRHCTACSYYFCVFCSKAWHYGNPCNIVSNTALIEAYQKTAEGSMERKMMEMKYGKVNLERMVRTFEEEKSNRAWIEANTQRCPCCHVNITKSFGCNHMACKACNTHFCYRCGTRLPPNEPYKHFNTPGMPCYMKLFDADMMDAGGWEPIIGVEEMGEWEAENL